MTTLEKEAINNTLEDLGELKNKKKCYRCGHAWIYILAPHGNHPEEICSNTKCYLHIWPSGWLKVEKDFKRLTPGQLIPRKQRGAGAPHKSKTERKKREFKGEYKWGVKIDTNGQS